MNHSQFSNGPYASHPYNSSPYDVHPSDAYSNSVHPTPESAAPKAADAVDWPETHEIHALLHCGNENCPCHRPNSRVHCPACKDSNPSLSVDEASNPGDSGSKSLWFCHAGCPQDAVTKALHKVVFEGPTPTAAATSSGDNAASAAPKALKTLRQRGIGVETRQHFGLDEYATLGVIYPTFWSNGVAGPMRIKRAYSNSPKYRWIDETLGGEDESDQAQNRLPTVYNTDVIHDSKRMRSGLFIVKSESEVWTMHQAGMASICSLAADRDPEQLVRFLRRARNEKVQAIFGNDVEGRQLALRLREVCEAISTDDFKVNAKIRLVDGGLGFDLGALFALVKFDAKKFRDEIEQLQFAPRSLIEAWRENPEAGLPDLEPETADEGATANSSNIGANGLFECLDEAGLAALPLPECVVEGVVLEGRPTIFYGLFGTGKSIIALDMALSVSQNMPWCGRETKPGMAFFVAGEGANGLKKRVAAWKKYHGVESTPLFRVIRHPVILSDPAQCQSLIKTIKDRTRLTGTPAALVVIDTLALCIGESDENSQGEMTKFLKAAESICLATGAALLILHHPNRQGDARGSTALPSNSDGFLALEGKTSSEVVKLNPSKVRDMGENGGIKLRRVVITLEDMLDSRGNPVTSAVFVPVQKGEEGDDDIPENESPKRAKSSAKSKVGSKTAKPEGALSEKVEATWQALLHLNANSNAIGAAGITSVEWAALAKEQGVSGATFERAKKKLQELGKVSCDAPGKIGARFKPKI